MTSTSGDRRKGFRSFLVEPYKQVRIGLFFLIINLMFSVLLFFAIGYIFHDIFEAQASIFNLTGYENAITFEKYTVPMTAIGVLIALFILTTLVVSVRYTHGIYGPLVSINRFLDDMLAGRYPNPISMRNSDQLVDLATKLNLIRERVLVDKRGAAMTSIHRFLDDLVEGKTPTPLSFRDEDPHVELAKKLNRLAEAHTKQ